jgi:hypothetical protein
VVKVVIWNAQKVQTTMLECFGSGMPRYPKIDARLCKVGLNDFALPVKQPFF